MAAEQVLLIVERLTYRFQLHCYLALTQVFKFPIIKLKNHQGGLQTQTRNNIKIDLKFSIEVSKLAKSKVSSLVD